VTDVRGYLHEEGRQAGEGVTTRTQEKAERDNSSPLRKSLLLPLKKIRGEEHTYRIRVGQFRILYEVDDENFRVVIFKIERREQAYR